MNLLAFYLSMNGNIYDFFQVTDAYIKKTCLRILYVFACTIKIDFLNDLASKVPNGTVKHRAVTHNLRGAQHPIQSCFR